MIHKEQGTQLFPKSKSLYRKRSSVKDITLTNIEKETHVEELHFAKVVHGMQYTNSA